MLDQGSNTDGCACARELIEDNMKLKAENEARGLCERDLELLWQGINDQQAKAREVVC